MSNYKQPRQHPRSTNETNIDGSWTGGCLLQHNRSFLQYYCAAVSSLLSLYLYYSYKCSVFWGCTIIWSISESKIFACYQQPNPINSLEIYHTGQQIRSKIDSFQNANFLISQSNRMMLPLIGIVSERRFQWGSHHRVWLRNEKVIMKTVLFTL